MLRHGHADVPCVSASRYFREYKEWHANGHIAWYEQYNEDGTKEGACKQWYEDGTPKLLCHYKKGVLHGEWKQWFEDGVLWNHRYYKDGEIHGEARSWNEKGVLKSQGFYKNGKRHGEYKAWRKGSQLMSHSYFKYLFHARGVVPDWHTSPINCLPPLTEMVRGTECASIGGATEGSTY